MGSCSEGPDDALWIVVQIDDQDILAVLDPMGWIPASSLLSSTEWQIQLQIPDLLSRLSL